MGAGLGDDPELRLAREMSRGGAAEGEKKRAGGGGEGQ